ncbi:hypothetical protein [Dyadobacter sp. CY356]|uniref:hypothetical protein n=1 Tax=Dyadobacter sp. CY356 TaxID=2906442 RepID=UPI001F15F121|nr:hypothetical protein [Dyadobacter sp. CY356]MCF0055099.1 hypothetical protein [Dyadobacter sp. CY356]
MKRILVLLMFAIGLIPNYSKAQGYFTTGIVMAGNPYYVFLKDVYVAGSAVQGSLTGSFTIEQYGMSMVGGNTMLTAYGSYPTDPPSLVAPLVLRSRPAANTSFVTLINTATTSKSVTLEQYYNSTLISTQPITVPASTGTAGYTYLWVLGAAKTFTSRAALDGGYSFPQTEAEHATYYVKVIVNN